MASCSLCIIENTCTQVRLVTDRELSDPAFIRRLRDDCYRLSISSYQWLDFLTDQYRDLRGCIVDHTGRTVYLDMEVFEVPHIRDWFRDFCCTPCPPHITPYVRREARERTRVLATILQASYSAASAMQ